MSGARVLQNRSFVQPRPLMGSRVVHWGWDRAGNGSPGYQGSPTFVLKYNIRPRSLADPGTIEDVLRDLLGWPIGFETERSWPGV